jgi:hypothetical protein
MCVAASPLVQIAEEYGLATDADIQRRLPHFEPREISKLFEQLTLALRVTQQTTDHLQPSSFNFFVSAAMRGDRFCIHANCRLKKIPLIERYAALYADHVLLPVRMLDNTKSSRKISVETLLRTICSLRPMVDANIILPITTGLCVCRHCRPMMYDEVDSVSEIGKHIARQNLSAFTISYYWDRRARLHIFVIRGPEDYLDEGYAVRSFRKLPTWFRSEGSTRARELTQAEVIESELIEGIFNASAFDIITQASLARDNRCSYLSDSEAEAAFFDDPSLPRGGSLSRSEFAESLMHEVPMFSELSTNAILKLRHEYPEAFQAYRSALSAASAEQSELMANGELRTREFYRDVIEPKVDALRSLDASSRIASLKTVGLSLALPSVSLLFGLLDQGLPQTIAEAAKLFGAAGLAKAVADPIIDATKRHAAVKADPFFFLLRMDKSWKRERERCG